LEYHCFPKALILTSKEEADSLMASALASRLKNPGF